MPIVKRLRNSFPVLLVGLSAVAVATPVNAATTIPCDAGALREAINTANSTPGTADVLELTPHCNYALTASDPANTDNGLPVITSPITIQGHDSTVSRSSSNSFRIFQVGSLSPVDTIGELTLHDLTVRDGKTPYSGGGIWVSHGKLTTHDSTITGNTANFGGGVSSDSGTISLSTTSVTDNTANASTDTGIAAGGGIYNKDALTISNSDISGNHTPANRGGGIANVGNAELDHVTVSSNRAGSGPGGLDNTSSMKLSNSLVSGNTPTNCTGSPAAISGCND